MAIIPGSGYREIRARLRKAIREGTIHTLEAEATDHACYFCGKRIEGRMWMLTDSGIGDYRASEGRYPIGECCYQRSRIYEYCNEMPVGLN